MICNRCGKEKAPDGYKTCMKCREENRRHLLKRRQKVKGMFRWMPAQPSETLDEIARKAHKHNLSYGKYLEARARGMYLSEVDE